VISIFQYPTLQVLTKTRIKAGNADSVLSLRCLSPVMNINGQIGSSINFRRELRRMLYVSSWTTQMPGEFQRQLAEV